MKKVAMTAARPRVAAPVDEWVQSRLGQDDERLSEAVPEAVPEAAPAMREPTKRLTIDIPAGLHRRLKLGATERDLNIADVIRDLIAREFPVP
jgi:hypothetical protein